jgi:hypothetical protein
VPNNTGNGEQGVFAPKFPLRAEDRPVHLILRCTISGRSEDGLTAFARRGNGRLARRSLTVDNQIAVDQQ